ncbi:MAG TPA: L-seryl-tRNA(Sec) selenium transferase [Blastocatellia bacterium]|nr:L-seryl-tRNA(Sec) selenium transferase [Blastocatellia bacterium]
MTNERLRSLPSVERLLARPAATRLAAQLGRDRVRDLLRDILDEMRDELLGVGNQKSGVGSQKSEVRIKPEATADFLFHSDSRLLTSDSFLEEIERRLEARGGAISQPSLRRVINATGVIIHTNLGRAPLAAEAIDALSETAAHYSNLEYDLERGERGHREAHCQERLARLAASEAALVVNNNAAAVLLVLNTLAEQGEVIVSRGELIEIGGSFRIPEVMEKSGARLREVGTTNRTRVEDYERAINEQTRLLLRVHPSNYRIVGFTARPQLAELVELSRRTGVPVYEDLGSGCLVDLAAYGIKDEPVVAESLKAGVAVVTFSGDKMLGGPQAGIIAGTREIIERVRRNPLTRALRVDKLTYAALEATLRLYERGVAHERVPVIRAMAAPLAELRERAGRFCERVAQTTEQRMRATVEAGASVIGGGAAPEVKLPTALVALAAAEWSAATLAERLRAHVVPIIARAERDRLLIDLRTVAADEEGIILDALAAIAQPVPRPTASVNH